MRESLDQLGEVAAEAPETISSQFDLLIGVLQQLAQVLEQTEQQDADAAATLAAMREVLTPERAQEVDNASRDVEAFLRVECGFDADAADENETPPTSTAPGDPARLGDNADLDELATKCQDGDMVACDELYFSAPASTPYETYGDTCGGRTEVDDFCVNVYPPPEDGAESGGSDDSDDSG
jgi:hypothetical protein